MPSDQEYSFLAAAVYNDARGLNNQVVIDPTGWSALPGRLNSTGGNPLSSGLSITAYQKGSEIVIACKGTDFLFGSNNGQTASDLAADVALASALGSSQLFAASLFYQEIKEKNPTANITFTGHSLGAGLASVLSVWFNRPATVFADAPFELTALNPLIMGYVAGYLALNGYSDPEFLKFIGTYPVIYGDRESQVKAYFVEGELLSTPLLSCLPKVVGNSVPITIGGGNLVSSITLHSVVLHSSLVISEQLRKDTLLLPTLLARVLDTSFYAADLGMVCISAARARADAYKFT
jgi:hypothetical protein